MKRLRSLRGHVHLWLMMALILTLLLTVYVSAIVLSYRFSLEERYAQGLRLQLNEGLYELTRENFSGPACEQLSQQGIRMMILRDEDGKLLYREGIGLPFSQAMRQSATGNQTRLHNNDAETLLALVNQTLGTGEGQFFLTDEGEKNGSPRRSLESKDLMLCGRKQGRIFCLFLPVESTNAAINLAIRFVTVVSVVVWLVSMVLLYYLSKFITRPTRRIAEIATQISRLNFSRRCPPTLTVEINDLSQSINNMADSLASNVEALRQANERMQAELSERTRQQRITAELIANLSHDLKTPIAIISGYAEGLREGVARTPEKQQTYCEMILRESERMQDIVSRILALGRMESGETPIAPEDFDLAELLDQVIESFQLELEREGLELTKEGYRPCMVRTDYACVLQSVQNYIQNAVYHINNGTRIRVRVEKRGGAVRLSVTNSSAPIPPEKAVRLWDKLYRGDPSRKRSHGEMGLGLAIVKGNMERLGHAYGFENDPAFPGVTFWLELPGSAGAASAADTK